MSKTYLSKQSPSETYANVKWIAFSISILFWALSMPISVQGKCNSPPPECSGSPDGQAAFTPGNPDQCSPGVRFDPVATGSKTTSDGFEIWINVTVECDEPADPSNTGFPTVDPELCNGATITFSDSETPGDCPQEKNHHADFQRYYFWF